MSRFVRMLLATTLMAVAIAPTLQAAGEPQPLDPAAVLGAIDRGVAYLKREQSAKGRWDDIGGYDGGVTALCTLALINTGLDADDPAVAKGLEVLRRNEFDKTYAKALQVMALCAGEPNKDLLQITKLVRWLEETQIRNGDRIGSWSYPGAGGDPSNAQFALLALYEAQRIGVMVQPKVWQTAAAYWRRIQSKDGSWSYPGTGPSGSMTCAGIGALMVCSKAVSEGDAGVVGGKVVCCVDHQGDDAVERALQWLGRNFSVRRNPSDGGATQTWHYYYLYGVERAGRLTARRFIGDHDWYREGTEFLVRAQDPLSHFWKGRRHIEGNPHIGTAMALLFLSKGRRPLLMAKMEHGPVGAEGAAGHSSATWNAHRQDVDHLTRRTEEAWDIDLTWQTINPSGAAVEDLLQAPVLYVSGSKKTNLTQHAEKLRKYVDRGGFIFAESCCGNKKPFRAAIEKLVAQMFPEPEYKLRQLRPAHPLWRMERLVRPESPYVGSLWAVEYGCRTCMVFCDQDLSCYWELDNGRPGTEYPRGAQRRIDDATAIGLNVLAYATGREPRGKEQAFVNDTDDELLESSGTRGVIQIAKLQHGGGCNDAPGALANLTRAALRGDVKMQVRESEDLVGIGDPAFFKHHLYFMHGRHDFKLTVAERRRLEAYLTERDGMLLADSICASPAFTKAFRREILAALEGARLEQIPATDPIFTTKFGGYDVRQVTLRNPQPSSDNKPIAARTRQVPPQLEGIKINGRWRVIFSPQDLSCALERHEAVECRGYSREDAARLGLNVLLYSVNQ